MARQRMVTRTIHSKEVTLLMLDTVSSEPHNETVVFPATVSEDKALKYAREHFETETDKVCAIVNVVEKEALYGMPEVDFIKLAKPIYKKECEE